MSNLNDKRIYLLQRDGNKCKICSRVMRRANFANDVSDDIMTIDHIIPVSRGGTSETINLQLLCLKCNKEKNSRLPDDMVDKSMKEHLKHVKKTVGVKKKKKSKGWTFSITFKLSK